MSTKQHDLITADYDRKYEPGYGLNYPDTSVNMIKKIVQK